jgi:hypothetical protein
MHVPQYRCPRCSCQTCSAQCVKKHKEWHQCSGKRDPTAKVPKSQLFTPAGIDHDYNFITSIERSRADLEAKVPESRRVEGHSLRAGIASRNKNIHDRLALTRVNVEWAPVGMSRQKLNQSRWSKVINRHYNPSIYLIPDWDVLTIGSEHAENHMDRRMDPPGWW